MAKLVLLSSNVTLNGTDITDNVAAVTLSTTAAEVPTTSFGSGGAVTRVSGLVDNSVTLSLHNDYNAIDGLIQPLIGSTAVTMIVKPAGTAAASASFASLHLLCTLHRVQFGERRGRRAEHSRCNLANQRSNHKSRLIVLTK
jgi:hypothetical protein